MMNWQMIAGSALAASILASGQAAAQDWTHVACDYTWVIHERGERLESPTSNIYRFNATQIDRWVPATLSWYPECDPAMGGFTEADCSISDTSVSAVRRHRQGGQTTRLDSFGINRMTAVYTGHFEFSHARSGDARGTCRATEDPSAGLQRQF